MTGASSASWRPIMTSLSTQTKQDIAAIACAGLNWVRLPIPFWSIRWTDIGADVARNPVSELSLDESWVRKYVICVNLDLELCNAPGCRMDAVWIDKQRGQCKSGGRWDAARDVHAGVREDHTQWRRVELQWGWAGGSREGAIRRPGRNTCEYVQWPSNMYVYTRGGTFIWQIRALQKYVGLRRGLGGKSDRCVGVNAINVADDKEQI
ncbi:hypothetical protein B0H14DRAFT_2599424 [Mycena olivaceomarginata]|nr:hypothetical protein B0H14DRAFT_2599424 [Mycena olivaceomarginata]